MYFDEQKRFDTSLSDTVKHKYVHLSYSRTPSLHLWWQWEPQRPELTVTPQPSQCCRPVGWTAPETQSKQHRGGNRRWRRRAAGGATEAVALPQRPRSQQGGGKGRLLPVVMKHIYLIYIKWCIFFPCGVFFLYKTIQNVAYFWVICFISYQHITKACSPGLAFCVWEQP